MTESEIDNLIRILAHKYHGTVAMDYDGGPFFARISIGAETHHEASGASLLTALWNLAALLEALDVPS